MPTAMSNRPPRHNQRVIGDRIGENNADNEYVSSAVVANADGSLFERVEYLQGIATSIQSAQSAPASPATFFPGLGYNVVKLGNVNATTDPLFVVSGKCIVTMLVGEVTSVVGTTTSLQLTTSVGSRVLCASTDIVTEIANTLYMLSGDPDDVLTGTTQNVVGLAIQKTGVQTPFMINDNVINQTVDAAGTGLIEWNLYYIPVEAGAAITSAA